MELLVWRLAQRRRQHGAACMEVGPKEEAAWCCLYGGEPKGGGSMVLLVWRWAQRRRQHGAASMEVCIEVREVWCCWYGGWPIKRKRGAAGVEVGLEEKRRNCGAASMEVGLKMRKHCTACVEADLDALQKKKDSTG